jgi:hypothetical protein
MSKFEDRLIMGSTVEDFLAEYFEEVFGWKFVGGARNKEIINREFIEKTFSCKVGFGKKKKCPVLFFGKEEFTMPDQIYMSQRQKIFWVESKGSFSGNKNFIDIECKKIRDYFEVFKRTGTTVWVVVSVIRNGECNIFSATINKLYNTSLSMDENENNPNYKYPVYSFPIAPNFERLNSSPIVFR